MSHIPSSAMPHAKPHEPHEQAAPAAETPKPKPLPWLALAIGGALVAGTALTAATVLRTPAAKRRAVRKPAVKRATRTPAKPRRKKSEA